MPYNKFVKAMRGRKKYCTKNKRTGKIVCYSSKRKRETGMKMREMFAHMK